MNESSNRIVCENDRARGTEIGSEIVGSLEIVNDDGIDDANDFVSESVALLNSSASVHISRDFENNFYGNVGVGPEIYSVTSPQTSSTKLTIFDEKSSFDHLGRRSLLHELSIT